MKPLLSRKATTQGGRDGLIKAETSNLELSMAKPPEMGGAENTSTNPEEIFSMGYSACFASSLEYLLMHEEVKYEGIKVDVSTRLVQDGNQGFKFDIVVEASVQGVDAKTNEMFVNQAFQFCPYSKAIKENVNVTLKAI